MRLLIHIVINADMQPPNPILPFCGICFSYYR